MKKRTNFDRLKMMCCLINFVVLSMMEIQHWPFLDYIHWRMHVWLPSEKYLFLFWFCKTNFINFSDVVCSLLDEIVFQKHWRIVCVSSMRCIGVVWHVGNQCRAVDEFDREQCRRWIDHHAEFTSWLQRYIVEYAKICFNVDWQTICTILFQVLVSSRSMCWNLHGRIHPKKKKKN